MGHSVCWSGCGMATGHLEKRSTIVKQYCSQLWSGSLTRSRCRWWKRASGAENSPRAVRLCQRTLDCWQGTQDRAQRAISLFMLGQKSFWEMRRTEALMLGCARP